MMKFAKSMLMGLGLLLLLGIFSGSGQRGKKLRGTWIQNAGIFDKVKGEIECRIDSADGFVMVIEKEVDNPLFESKLPNRVKLMIWLEGNPVPIKRYYVSSDGCKGLCYREQGDLLMFETFTGSGWVEIGEIKKGKQMRGEIDLRLVEPHHNFSNSDFHYMGGEFVLDAK